MIPPPPNLDGLDEDERLDACLDAANAVGSAFGLRAQWSAGEVDFREVAFPGRWRVSYSDHWGEAAVASPEMADPTWLDLFGAADWAILRSGDGHHVFIEAFAPCESGAPMLRLVTGS